MTTKTNTKYNRQVFEHKLRREKINYYYQIINKLKYKTLTSGDKTLLVHYIEKIHKIELLL
jgi:hypothetical protein